MCVSYAMHLVSAGNPSRLPLLSAISGDNASGNAGFPEKKPNPLPELGLRAGCCKSLSHKGLGANPFEWFEGTTGCLVFASIVGLLRASEGRYKPLPMLDLQRAKNTPRDERRPNSHRTATNIRRLCEDIRGKGSRIPSGP